MQRTDMWSRWKAGESLHQIGQERAKILEAMKQALLCGDEEEALERARELTGLPKKRPECLLTVR
jgi:hypothetical protein